MKTDDPLRKRLQSIDEGRVRGRLKANFGYMRSDEIARVQEMKKKAKTSVSHILDSGQRSQRSSKVVFNEKALKRFQVQITNHIQKRNCDPEVIVRRDDLRVLRRNDPKKAFQENPEVELDFEVGSSQESSPHDSDSKMAADVLVV